MATLSLCMIVKNEEDVLARCLKSCKNLFDEIIIVDTGSTDNTVKIAKTFTDKIFHFDWCDDFSLARNFSFSKAKGDYIMWLDADDVIPSKSLKQLLELKPKLSSDTYMLKYDIAFENARPTFSYYRERIIKNCNNAKWQGVVHECITPFGVVEKIDISIWHKKEKFTNSARNLNIYKKLTKMRELNPREQYYYGRELFDHKKYIQCYSVLDKFVTSGQGWQENIIDALALMSRCQRVLKDDKKALSCLFKTFEYDAPRANVCCGIADIFLSQKKYQQAIFWYDIATKCTDVSKKGGFVQNIYYNYYPYLQMCFCHYCLGDNNTAYKYNKKAEKFNKSQETKHNNEYFKKVLGL